MKNAYLLHIESATDVCSVAVSEGARVLHTLAHTEVNNHAAVITLLIDQCVSEAQLTLAQLDAIVLSAGPGSYTSLRVGAATAKGLCYGLKKPLIAVPTLQALAYAAAQQVGDVTALYRPMIDARRMEVYTQAFNAEAQALSETEAVIVDETAFESEFEKYKTLIFCGNGAPKCQTVLTHPSAQFIPLVADATHLVALGYQRFLQQQWEDVAYYEPFYFKAPHITTPKTVML